MTDTIKTTKKATAAKPKTAAAKTVAGKAASETVKPDVAKKTIAKPAPAKKTVAAAPKKKAVAKSTARSTGKTLVISAEQRYHMVAEAAYFRAEKSRFESDPVRDWIEAEKEIAALLDNA